MTVLLKIAPSNLLRGFPKLFDSVAGGIIAWELGLLIGTAILCRLAWTGAESLVARDFWDAVAWALTSENSAGGADTTTSVWKKCYHWVKPSSESYLQ